MRGVESHFRQAVNTGPQNHQKRSCQAVLHVPVVGQFEFIDHQKELRLAARLREAEGKCQKVRRVPSAIPR